MVKPELGTKRTCPSCGTRFYDLLKNPIVCPKCGVTFIAEALLPSKGDSRAAAAPKPPARSRSSRSRARMSSSSVSRRSEAGEDDETAAIEDVDLGEEEPVDGEEDDAFLEAEEEDGGDVTDIIGGGRATKEGEEDLTGFRLIVGMRSF